MSLVLDTKTAARLYITGASEGDTADYTYKRWFRRSEWDYYYYSKSEDIAGTAKAKTGAKGVYFEIPNITAASLMSDITLTYNGQEYTFSPLSYCYRVKNRADANEKTVALAKAFFDLAKYANEYLNYTTYEPDIEG